MLFRSDEALPGDEKWLRLPKSAEEVHSIARMVRGRSELYVGPNALKKHLLAGKAKAVPLLHFSTHAAVDGDDPERSRILFSPEGGHEGLDYLFLGDIYDLDLHGVDLVTVSACETERGRIIRGEGVEAFSRAFLAAGARAAVTSLWRVADQPTAEFMKQFYYFVGAGWMKCEALRQTKLRFIRSGSALAHPRHWAPFVLNGEGLRPAPAPFPWSTVLLVPAAVMVLLGFVLRLGRRASGAR